jgi:hypothetical protein
MLNEWFEDDEYHTGECEFLCSSDCIIDPSEVNTSHSQNTARTGVSVHVIHLLCFRRLALNPLESQEALSERDDEALPCVFCGSAELASELDSPNVKSYIPCRCAGMLPATALVSGVCDVHLLGNFTAV